MRIPRSILITGAVTVLAAGSWLLLRPAAVQVESAVVVRRPLQVTIDEEGETRVRDRYIIAAPVAGRLHRITLEAGDMVPAGTVLARMNPLPLDPRMQAEADARIDAATAAQQAADARVEQARATLAQAQRTAA